MSSMKTLKTMHTYWGAGPAALLVRENNQLHTQLCMFVNNPDDVISVDLKLNLKILLMLSASGLLDSGVT